MSVSRNIIFFGIVVFLLGIAGGLTIKKTPPSSTPDQTTNWKTYDNPTIPLQFKYPANYTLNDNSSNENRPGSYDIRISSPTTPNKGLSYTDKDLGIEIFITPKEDQRLITSDADLPIMSKKTVNISGVNATQVDYQAEGYVSSFYFVYNNLQFRIDKYPTATSRDDEFTRIISTFKFSKNENTKNGGQLCGGVAANLPENQCPEGFYCKLEGAYPDASGICVKK